MSPPDFTAGLRSPTLSVVMCNYNHGRYLPRALDAITSQSRTPDEFIILDDGSTDQSVSIIEPYAQRCSYIRFLRNERNTGAVAAVQRAFGMATGDYVYFGAADDYVLPDFFEKAMVMAAQYPQAGSVVGECVVIDADGQERTVLTGPGWKTSMMILPDAVLADYLCKVTPTHSFVAAVIYRRSCLLDVGGLRPELEFWIDTFAFRAIGLKYGFCFMNHRCACWRVTPGSLCQITINDPKREFRILHHLERMMRSDEFRELFPAEYVAKWSHDYQYEIVQRVLERYASGVGAANTELWPNLEGRFWLVRAFHWGLRRFDGLYRMFLGTLLKNSLSRSARRPFN